MKQNKYLLALSILVLWGYSSHTCFAQTPTEQREESSIELHFKDKETLLPVYDVNVWINQEAIPSNSQGLISLPKGIKKTDVIKVSSIGYKTIQLHFGDIEQQNGQNVILLIPDTKRLDEVVVRGTKSSVSLNSVSSTINSQAIQGAMGKSLASLLENVSGVSSIQTGTSTAKPVIHGMYGNRILMINNGARQTGQQWGLDHAPEIDKNNSANIKVIKGAESVRYGSKHWEELLFSNKKHFHIKWLSLQEPSQHFTEATENASMLLQKQRELCLSYVTLHGDYKEHTSILETLQQQSMC